MKTQTKVAAVLTLRRAGAWSPRGRRDIAAWLRKQADFLVAHGKDYPEDSASQSRYCY